MYVPPVSFPPSLPLPSPFPPHSRLLQVDESTLKQALVTRKSWAGGSEFVVAYKCEQATYTRDAMAKALYGALFDWIVEQVCECVGDVGVSEGKCEVCGCEGEGVGRECVTIPGHVPHSSTSVAIYEEEATHTCRASCQRQPCVAALTVASMMSGMLCACTSWGAGWRSSLGRCTR